jgi:hypothetical protein
MNSDTLTPGYNHFQSLTMAADTSGENVSEARPSEKFITETRHEPIFINPLPLQQYGFIWQTAALLLALCILALMKIARRNIFKNLFAAFFSKPIFKQFLRDSQLFPPGSVLPLFMAVILVYSVLIFQFKLVFNFSALATVSEELPHLVNSLLLVSGFLGVKYLLHYLVGLVFGTIRKTREYLANSFYFNTIAAVILLPFLFGAIFSKSATILFVVIFIVLVMIALRIIRGITIAFEVDNYSGFQKIVYFCTLEIIPVLAVYKLVFQGDM